MIVVVRDLQLFAGDVNALRHIQLGRVDAQVDVGHKGPEQQHAIAVLTYSVTSALPIAPS